jgi:hypothetical protein
MPEPEEEPTKDFTLLDNIHAVLETNALLQEKVTVSDDPEKPIDREKLRLVIEAYKTQLRIEANLIRHLVEDSFSLSDGLIALAEKAEEHLDK